MAKVPSPVQDALNQMSYSEIARKSGTTLGYVSLLFRGYRGAKTDTLERLADALGVDLAELHAYLKALPKRGQKHGWQQAKAQVGASV